MSYSLNLNSWHNEYATYLLSKISSELCKFEKLIVISSIVNSFDKELAIEILKPFYPDFYGIPIEERIDCIFPNFSLRTLLFYACLNGYTGVNRTKIEKPVLIKEILNKREFAKIEEELKQEDLDTELINFLKEENYFGED